MSFSAPHRGQTKRRRPAATSRFFSTCGGLDGPTGTPFSSRCANSAKPGPSGPRKKNVTANHPPKLRPRSEAIAAATHAETTQKKNRRNSGTSPMPNRAHPMSPVSESSTSPPVASLPLTLP